MTCWESNPVRYRREYFEAGKKLDTKYLRFGKGFAEVVEDLSRNPELFDDAKWVKDKLGFDIESEEFLDFKSNLVIYDSPEYEIRTVVKGVPILSYIDSYNSIDNVFREYKTGKIPWTKVKVIKHGQLVFYATALKYSVGQIPEYCHLDWIETKEYKPEKKDFWREDGKKLRFTGKIKEFERQFDEREIEKMEKRIVKAATEISKAYQEFIKEI